MLTNINLKCKNNDNDGDDNDDNDDDDQLEFQNIDFINNATFEKFIFT